APHNEGRGARGPPRAAPGSARPPGEGRPPCPPQPPSRRRRTRCPPPWPPPPLEGLEKLDQGALVVVAQPRLLLEGAGAEVVAAVHDVVRALAELEETVPQLRELPARLLVGGLGRQRAQVVLDVEEQLKDLRAVLDAIRHAV